MGRLEAETEQLPYTRWGIVIFLFEPGAGSAVVLFAASDARAANCSARDRFLGLGRSFLGSVVWRYVFVPPEKRSSPTCRVDACVRGWRRRPRSLACYSAVRSRC